MKKGFTLVELLLVIAILGIAVGVTTDILLSLVRSYGKTQIINDIEQNANFVTAKLEKELREANSVTDVTSGGIPEISLVLDAKTVYYRLANGELLRRVDSSSYQNITQDKDPGGVFVACGSVDGISCFNVVTGSPTIVSYSFIFSQPSTITGSVFSESIETGGTVVIRNSY